MYVNLRFVRGKRVGRREHRAHGRRGRARARRAGRAIAANVDELEDWPGLPEADAALPLPEAWSDNTATASPELRAEGARAVIAAADEAGVTAYGSFSHDAEALAVANSKGIAVSPSGGRRASSSP